ncbi:Rev-Erb beta 2 [Bacillus sp. AR18-7]|uniref:Rev-Erb beta 2 n=1 Tax=Bacillus sp. AR18-7 TaxID=2217821 RepID=UPI0011CB552B|nr:Rev-Erb beta 2 [Bacillus sp. AR18-7]TXR64488.1 Rev-Erb beta 2 [Bacillus sp. AR18-7]
MAIQAHKCNNSNCTGHIKYDNADFNYDKALINQGGVLEKVHCDTCGKSYMVVVSHILIEVNKDGEFVQEVPSCDYPNK